jgi:hypothetical protein
MSDDFEEFYLATVRRTYRTARWAAAGDPDIAHDATVDAYFVMLCQWSMRRTESIYVNSVQGGPAGPGELC